jgi:hypothetical protein
MTPRVLVTVRPGPVLHLWQDGGEAARVPLDTPAALALIAALAGEVRAALARGEVATRGGECSGLQHSPLAPTAADLGLRRYEIHAARKLRDECPANFIGSP